MSSAPKQSKLAEKLARAEALKQHMAELLRELEEAATGRPIDKPGVWRHHPIEWAGQNSAKKLT